jgi:hypothetical protein
MGDVRDFLHRVLEGVLIRVGRFRESAQLPNELERRRANLVVRRGRGKIMQGLNVSAHEESLPRITRMKTDLFSGHLNTRVYAAKARFSNQREFSP